MVTKPNPVGDLVGVGRLQLQFASMVLPEGERDPFLDSITRILNSDEHGRVDIVDPKEAPDLARLIIRNPAINFRSIMAADVDDYVNNTLRPGLASEVEAKVDVTLKLVRFFPHMSTITFDGRSYNPRWHDVNALINDALEAGGSGMRLFFSEGDDGIGYLYGRMQFERKDIVGGRDVRFIALDWGDVQADAGAESESGGSLGSPLVSVTEIRASTDLMSTAVVNTRQIRTSVNQGRVFQNVASYYGDKRAVHRRIYDHFYRNINDGFGDDVSAQVQLTLYHEQGHIEMETRYGTEFYWLANQFGRQNGSVYPVIKEIYAELRSFEYLLSLSDRDKDAAFKTFVAWAADRGVPSPDYPIFSECTTSLLLSAAHLDGDNIIVDWARLRRNVSSFKALIEGIIADADIKLLRATEDLHKCFDGELESYEDLVSAVSSKLKEKTPNSPDYIIDHESRYELLNLWAKWEGAGVLEQFRSAEASYKESIDRWMEESLGLDKDSTPFKRVRGGFGFIM